MVSCSDIHLSPKPPIARSVEKDWYAVQAGYLRQLKRIANGLVIVIAGDLFDDGWRVNNCPPELINFALEHLPNCYAIPGQHDLPGHRLDEMKKSAYWTLVKAGRVTNLSPGFPLEVASEGSVVRLHGFPWGVPLKPLKDPHDLVLEVAVAHEYLWTRDSGYEGAPKDKKIGNSKERFTGYDVVLTGDNHQHFRAKVGETEVFNHGFLTPRKSDERYKTPVVAVVFSDGTVRNAYLKVEKDKWLDEGDLPKVAEEIGFSTLAEEFANLGASALSFADTIKRLTEREKVGESVKEIIAKLLEGAKR